MVSFFMDIWSGLILDNRTMLWGYSQWAIATIPSLVLTNPSYSSTTENHKWLMPVISDRLPNQVCLAGLCALITVRVWLDLDGQVTCWVFSTCSAHPNRRTGTGFRAGMASGGKPRSSALQHLVNTPRFSSLFFTSVADSSAPPSPSTTLQLAKDWYYGEDDRGNPCSTSPAAQLGNDVGRLAPATLWKTCCNDSWRDPSPTPGKTCHHYHGFMNGYDNG